MKKTILLFFALATSIVAINAQDASKAYETTGKLDKKISGSCVAIRVNSDLATAQDLMASLLKKEGLKGKKKGKTLNYEKTVFLAISADYINLNIAFEASKSKNESATTVLVFVSKGVDNNFVSSASDQQLIENLKNYLNTTYVTTVYNNDVALRIAAKKKEIETTLDEMNSSNKTVEKRTKDITGYEKDIDKAKANIEKAKSDIETAKKTAETKKTQLQKQQAELQQIK